MRVLFAFLIARAYPQRTKKKANRATILSPFCQRCLAIGGSPPSSLSPWHYPTAGSRCLALVLPRKIRSLRRGPPSTPRRCITRPSAAIKGGFAVLTIPPGKAGGTGAGKHGQLARAP